MEFKGGNDRRVNCETCAAPLNIHPYIFTPSLQPFSAISLLFLLLLLLLRHVRIRGRGATAHVPLLTSLVGFFSIVNQINCYGIGFLLLAITSISSKHPYTPLLQLYSSTNLIVIFYIFIARQKGQDSISINQQEIMEIMSVNINWAYLFTLQCWVYMYMCVWIGIWVYVCVRHSIRAEKSTLHKSQQFVSIAGGP